MKIFKKINKKIKNKKEFNKRKRRFRNREIFWLRRHLFASSVILENLVHNGSIDINDDNVRRCAEEIEAVRICYLHEIRENRDVFVR